MKIKVFEIASVEDNVYNELLEQYKTNPKLKKLLNKFIFKSNMIWSGDLRLITMLKFAINSKNIKAYLVKDVETNTFLWAIGKFLYNEKISMYPLLKRQSKKLQLEIRRVLIENGLLKESNSGHR
ncbi:MAG: hypothetical protein FWH35_00130 [Treponema sp.]|nr:hypothetical protein [Treponema sp.]